VVAAPGGGHISHWTQGYTGPGVVGRAFGAQGPPAGTLTPSPEALPIAPVPGIPGGTLINPQPYVPVGRSPSYPMPGGTNTRVSADYGHRMAAQVNRGHGPVGTRAAEGFVHSGTRTPGVQSNVPLVDAMARIDQKNPMIARATQPPMVTGSTRVYGSAGLAPTEQSFVSKSASEGFAPSYSYPDTSVRPAGGGIIGAVKRVLGL